MNYYAQNLFIQYLHQFFDELDFLNEQVHDVLIKNKFKSKRPVKKTSFYKKKSDDLTLQDDFDFNRFIQFEGILAFFYRDLQGNVDLLSLRYTPKLTEYIYENFDLDDELITLDTTNEEVLFSEEFINFFNKELFRYLQGVQSYHIVSRKYDKAKRDNIKILKEKISFLDPVIDIEKINKINHKIKNYELLVKFKNGKYII